MIQVKKRRTMLKMCNRVWKARIGSKFWFRMHLSVENECEENKCVSWIELNADGGLIKTIRGWVELNTSSIPTCWPQLRLCGGVPVPQEWSNIQLSTSSFINSYIYWWLSAIKWVVNCFKWCSCSKEQYKGYSVTHPFTHIPIFCSNPINLYKPYYMYGHNSRFV